VDCNDIFIAQICFVAEDKFSLLFWSVGVVSFEWDDLGLLSYKFCKALQTRSVVERSVATKIIGMLCFGPRKGRWIKSRTTGRSGSVCRVFQMGC
jgi:hypothetical protein